jgi:hypothetical protein
MSNLDVRNNLAFRNTNLGFATVENPPADAIVKYEKGSFKTLSTKEAVAFHKMSDRENVSKKKWLQVLFSKGGRNSVDDPIRRSEVVWGSRVAIQC